LLGTGGPWPARADQSGEDDTMAIKDILVHLDASARSQLRLDAAAALASRHAAHLTGVYVVELLSPAAFYGDPSGFVDARLIDEMIGKLRATATREALPVEQGFRERLRREGIEGEWRMVEGWAAEIVPLHARYADLAIVGQPDPKDSSVTTTRQIPVAALMSSGRPVLVLPYAGTFATIGRTVLVGWKSGREAARAVNDALPLLRHAGKVTVLAINPDRGIGANGGVPAADIALHLARHGVKAEAAHTVATDVPDGDVLLNYADDIGADLIVCGGYGHSRMRELAFGGVTRTLMTTMTVPVFMSH
jgi:nucleotide-binding universal stress UspA family protein